MAFRGSRETNKALVALQYALIQMVWDCGVLLAASVSDAGQAQPRLAGCYLGRVVVNWLHCEQLVLRSVSETTYLSPAVSTIHPQGSHVGSSL